MKTFQKVLCVMLSILMAISCLSTAAFATEHEKFTSTLKTTSSVSNKESAKIALDELDKILKEFDIKEVINVKEIVRENVGDLAAALIPAGFVLTFDFTSVNALCQTIDNYKLSIDILSNFMGDLKELEIKSWKEDMSRPNDDITIITELIELIAANKSVIEKVCDGSIDLGILLNSFIKLNDLLGPDGVSGLLRGLIVGFVYEEGTPEYNNAYKNIDSFIFNDLIFSFTEEVLPGLTISTASTIDSLLIDVYNISLEKYLKPELTELDIDLMGSDIPELKALGEIVNLKGITYDFSGLTYSHNKTLKAQINTVIGNYIKNLVPKYTGWKTENSDDIENGDYYLFNTNIENVIRYVAKESKIIENADSKSLEEIGVEIALIILKNGDFGAYEAGLEKCSTLEEMATALLINTANEMKIGVSYTGKESYLVVAGDLFAAWAYDNFPFTDYNGKTYRPGAGKDIFEVANYFANYFLFDRAGAAVLGISTTKNEAIFAKLDKIIDYFGEEKAVNFSTKDFLMGTSKDKGIIDCIFTLDIGKLLDLTIVPVLDNAGPVHAAKFIYNTVYLFLKNWAGNKEIFPKYQEDKAFSNALSNSNIANMVSVLLETVNNRKASVITLSTFVAALILNDKTAEYTIESASIANLVATGKALSPKATVKAGGKALTQNKDYIILSDTATAPGTYNAVIKGIGLYSGEIERSFTVLLDKVSSISFSNATASSVKLTWGKVPYAKSYIVSRSGSSKKVTVTGTSYTVTGLSAGKEYKLSVQAVGADGKATAAKEITVYTVPSALSSSKLKASPSATSVKLSWSAVSGATHYRIERYSSKKWKTVATTSKTSYTVSGLSGYTSYTFRVTALKKLPNGSYLAASPVTVKAKTLLGTPSSLKASATASTMTLTWSKVSNADKYQVRQYTGGKWKTLTTTKKTSYKISKLKAGTKYKFSVRAVVGKSTYGSAKEVSSYTLLSTPSKVKVASTTTTSAKLSWSKVSGASSYEVYAYIGKKWKKAGSTKKTSITVKELPAGTKTKLKIRAVSKNTKSAYSAEVTALTLVAKVSSLKTAERKTTSIKMSWKKVTGATSYEIYRYNGSKWKKIGTTKKTTYTDSKSLKKGTQYQYKVRAVQKVSKKTTRYGAYSSVLKAKTTLFGTARF